LHEAVAESDRVVTRWRWQATAAVDGLPVAKGAVMRAEVAQFFTVADGKIVRAYERDAVTDCVSGTPAEGAGPPR
jgi:ketosteroid isomerase-like protein